MPHIHHAGFQSWDVTLTLTLILEGMLYVRGWVKLRKLHLDSAAVCRLASFLIGLFLIWRATASPIAALDRAMLTGHMVQHLVLMTLVPPLIWLGSPVKVVLRGLPRRLGEVSGRVLLSTSVRLLGKATTQLSVCWLAAAAALIGWHIPSVFALAMRSGTWHGIEQGSFLLAGLLFWWPVIRPWPSTSNSPQWTILLYLFLATLPCDILSGFLVFCDRVIYPVYFSSSGPSGFSGLEDQQCAGALMWTVVTVVYLVAGTICVARLLAPTNLRLSQSSMLEPQSREASQGNAWTLETV